MMINGQRKQSQTGVWKRRDVFCRDSPWPARSPIGERCIGTGGWWCLGPRGLCGWSGRGSAGGTGAPEVGDNRWRSGDKEPHAEPSIIHPTARSNIQSRCPSWGFPLGTITPSSPSHKIFKRKWSRRALGSQKKWLSCCQCKAGNSIAREKSRQDPW